MPRVQDLPDWRDAGAYAPLLQVERAAFAWEWLRRQEHYRSAALGQMRRTAANVVAEHPAAAAWGLHIFENPHVPAPQARPVWCADRFPLVLNASAEVSGDGPDAFLLERLSELSTLVCGASGERLLLSNGYRSIRIDVRGASIHSGPVKLSYDVSGIRSARTTILVIERLCALTLNRRFSPTLHRPDRRCGRNILLLRAHDALVAGADQRTIAAALLSRRAVESRWRVESASLRSQAQRLVQGARAMAAGAFWKLLRGP